MRQKATIEWATSPANDYAEIEDVLRDVKRLGHRAFDELWVARIVEAATCNPLTIGQLSQILIAVRLRYRLKGMGKTKSANLVCPRCGNHKTPAAKRCRQCWIRDAKAGISEQQQLQRSRRKSRSRRT